MKIKGQTIKGPNVEIIVFPRPQKRIPATEGDPNSVDQIVSGDIVIKAQAVLDYDEFVAICPLPEPPTSKRPNGQTFKNYEHQSFKDKLADWARKKSYWMILKSLQATEGLEWEKVNMADSATWGNFLDELKEAGFSEIERIKIQDTVLAANSMNEAKMTEARERFLADQGAVLKQ